MIKKVVAGALVLVIIGVSQTTGHAAYKPFPSSIYSVNANRAPVEIISPKGDIIVQDSLLISVQVFDNASVTLNIYKQDTEGLEDLLIFGPDKVDGGENLKFYTKQLKDLSQGKYRMEFDVEDKEGNKEDPIIKYFTVKNKEAEINKSLDDISKTNTKNILENILERNKE